MTGTRKRKRAGRLERVFNLNNSEILGAGGYGIVLTTGRRAIKLLYDLDACRDLYREAQIQEKARRILEGIVRVPKVYSYMSYPIQVKNTHYLCGIEMERIPVLEEFGEPLHILLGYSGGDINTSWGRSSATEISPENPSRGFFAGPDILEEIFADDGITLEGVALTMGVALRALLDGGILPNDLEFIYGGDGKIYLADFGLCEFGKADPEEFLNRQSSSGLRGDIYIPHKGNRGYEEFMEGFLKAPAKPSQVGVLGPPPLTVPA
jgi:hypothetical protein